jgi:hypothetical protein
MDTMRRRINSRCKGLLEIKGFAPLSGEFDLTISGADPTIQYLHRTVKDYIESNQAPEVLQPVSSSTYGPELRRLSANVAYLKGLPPFKLSAIRLFNDCLEQSRMVLPSSIPRMIQLLDELK